jgi:DNA-binding response OmpR family regulator
MYTNCLLVVEDDPRIASLVCHVAAEAGFKAYAATGPEAITQAYLSVQPDLIVLDVFMPDMDGLEVLQFLRQQFSNARIVIISGSDSTSRRMTENLGKALGFNIEANISKPFQIAELRTLFERIGNSLDESRKALSP